MGMSAQQPPCPPLGTGGTQSLPLTRRRQAQIGRPRRAGTRARVSLRTTLPRRPRRKGDVVVGVRLCSG